MKPLTLDRPKPMIEVAGRPLIDHTLALIDDLPAARTVVNLHYKADILQRHLAGRDLQTSLEWPDILDTGGGLRYALPLLGAGPVITLNSDAIWVGDNPLEQLCGAWRPEQMDGLLMCVPKGHVRGYTGPGNFVPDASGLVTRGDGLVYGGAQIIKTELLQTITARSFSLNVLWDMMIAKNSLYALKYAGKWSDVGHPQGIPIAEALLADQDV